MDQTKEHYSYKVYADPEIAKGFDADRFGGSVGQAIKQAQHEVVFANLGVVKGWKVLDLGAGTGRFSIPFLEAGAEVTACDASQQMLDVLRQKTADPKLQVMVADAHQLQFADGTFDCAVSFRMLLHVVDWKKALAELCRVSKDWLVIDFPPRHGFLILAPIRHAFGKLFSRNVQAYRTFPVREFVDELHKNGFDIVKLDYGFFLPLVIYRVFRSAGLMRAMERFFSAIGFTRIAGSPITLFARRKK